MNTKTMLMAAISGILTPTKESKAIMVALCQMAKKSTDPNFSDQKIFWTKEMLLPNLPKKSAKKFMPNKWPNSSIFPRILKMPLRC